MTRESGPTPSCGVVYVATGPAHLELAIASAESLERASPGLPADLFTDLPDLASGGPFARIHHIARPHRRSKLDCMARSRFERTLFLDSDTLVLGDVSDGFALLSRFEMALAHDVRRASDLIRTGWRVQTPYAFPQHNSGVIYYRRSATMLDFLHRWAEAFAESGLRRDQPVLRDLLWQSDIRYYVLPEEFNLRRVTHLDSWEPEDMRPMVLHSHVLQRHLHGSGPRIIEPAELLAHERAALMRSWQNWARANPGLPHPFAAAGKRRDDEP